MKLVLGVASYAVVATASNQFGWKNGAIEQALKNTDGTEASARRFREVKGMLRALLCFDYLEANPSATSCPHKEASYYRALRDYGCNCYPEGDDTVSSSDPNLVLWNMGNNGAPVDEVDAVCRNVWGKYHCYNYDGCEMGVDYTYHLDGFGNIICGPDSDPEYASDPDGFRSCCKKISLF